MIEEEVINQNSWCSSYLLENVMYKTKLTIVGPVKETLRQGTVS